MATLAPENIKLHSIHELSHTLGVSRSVVTRVIMQKGITSISLGRVTMIDDSGLSVLRGVLLTEGFEVQS
jgi:hypothetical protein